MDVVKCFGQAEPEVSSGTMRHHSDKVLEILRPRLTNLGFVVENREQKQVIKVPVLFGKNGRLDKHFNVDAWHEAENTVLEIEAGRAKTNYQFLKDLFEACAMVDVKYLAIAVRKVYRRNKDFEDVLAFFDTIYASGRLGIPLDGVMIIGY